MKRAIADDVWTSIPGIPWSLPDKLPPLGELRAGIALLEAQLVPVSPAIIATEIVGPLLVAWQVKQTAAEGHVVQRTWQVALADLPRDLAQAGCLEVIRHHKFGMPAPADLRKPIEAKFNRRKVELQRLRTMAEKVSQSAPKPAQSAPAESTEDRLRHAIRRGLQIKAGEISGGFLAGSIWRWACNAERQLAELESRKPEAWVDEDLAGDVVPKHSVFAAVQHRTDAGPSSALGALPARIRYWRSKGATAMVDRLTAELTAELTAAGGVENRDMAKPPPVVDDALLDLPGDPLS